MRLPYQLTMNNLYIINIFTSHTKTVRRDVDQNRIANLTQKRLYFSYLLSLIFLYVCPFYSCLIYFSSFCLEVCSLKIM